MNHRLGALLLFVLGGCGVTLAATVDPQPQLPVTTRGQSVTVTGDGFTGQITVYLRTGKEAKGDRGYKLPGTLNDDGKGKSVTFKLPDDAPTGDYLVFVEVGGQEIPVPGELRVVPDAAAKITIDSISPSTDYPNPETGAFDLVIAGQNLARAASDNTLIAVDSGPVRAGSEADCNAWKEAKDYKGVCLSYDPGMEGQKLKVTGYHPERFHGLVNFEIRVGNNTSNAQKIVFSRMRAETLRLAAIGVFVVLAAIVFGLVLRGVRENRLAGEKTGPLAAFFLDRQSNSFSLSKFQLLAWTSVAVFSYVYLFFCKMFVQWTFTFPPIPENLPTLLGISAGTTVASLGITVNHGSKGAGPLSPSLADFISTGGLVTGERFQFFVWTLVGCLGFLGIVLSSDPGALVQLPDVPGAFLTLTGISAAGYLAGKLVRQPGPVIDLLTIVEVTPAAGGNPGVMKIQLRGQNLLESAVVKVDKEELRIDQFTIRGITKQDQPSGTDFCSAVEVDLLDAERYRTGTHLLYLVNGDGQSTCEAFPMNPLAIDTVPALVSGTDPVELNLVGRNFAAGLGGTWIDAENTAHTIADSDIRFVDSNHLRVTLAPGPVGTGRLVMETPAKLLASVSITVVQSK